MPLRHIDQANLDYSLVLFDSDGNERREQDGSLLSRTLSEAVRDGVTDVFLSSHGWKGDVPAAISQYNSWIGAMAAQAADRDRARGLDPDFKAMIVGVHWPSLPWGNEDAGAALLGDDETGEFMTEQQMGADELVQRYAERIADTPAAQTALATILAAADDDEVEAHLADGTLPDHLERAYQTLFDQAGLGFGGATAVPGSDQQAFTPTRIIGEWAIAAGESAQPSAGGQPGLLGGRSGRNIKDALLMPVRQLSFWAMKHRACQVGETGVHSMLIELQDNAPRARFHLMGHSFGCIVVLAAISGPLDQGTVTSRLPRPVHSLFLVQGALSLWSFAQRIPFPPNLPGYFRPIDVAPALVSGPIVTTRSTFDHAVGTFFPLGARLGDSLLLGDDLPEFGGVGAFGLQGTPPGTTHDALVLDADAEYGFEAGHIYNIDASTVIRHGSWPSGAHNDIAHPQIAHMFWQTSLSGIVERPPSPIRGSRSELLGSDDSVDESAPTKVQATRWPDQRFFLAELEDHPAGQPLTRDQQYTITFSVGPSSTAAIVEAKFSDEAAFPAQALAAAYKESEVLDLTVQLSSDDFEIFGDSMRPLLLPRTGHPRGKARFEIAPRRAGRCGLVANVHYQGSFLYQMELTITVGGGPANPPRVAQRV